MALFNSTLFNQALFGGEAAAPGRAQQVGQGLIYPALRKAGVTLGPGRTPSPAQFQDGIDELNRLIGSLNCDRLFIYSIARAEYPLTVAKPVYTIGIPADSFDEPDFLAPRPQLIETANIRQGDISYPLQVASDLEWADISLRNMPESIPEMLYNDRAYPLSSLYLWGQPVAGQTLELFTWNQVPTFLTITDAVVLPLQYEDALVLNLAVRLAPQFGRQVNADVRADAQKSLLRLESINAPRPIASVGFGGCGCDFDIYSGN